MNMLQMTLVTLVAVLYLATATVLVRQYLRVRDVSFLWLGVAVVVWPLLSVLLGVGQQIVTNRLTRGEAVFFPFTLVQRGRLSLGGLAMSLDLSRQLIGVGLLLVAVFYLCRTSGLKSFENSN